VSVVLSEHLPLLAGAPDGIQKLRGLILELAVRGKLVPQDPSDEPASVLLKRIAKNRDALLTKNDLPYSVPASWEWVRFASIYSLEYGDNLPAPKRTNSGEFPVYGSNGIVGSHSECCVKAPCIVVGRKGSAGALNLSFSAGCWVTDVAYYCIPPSELDLFYSFKLFHTLGLTELGKGIKPGLSRSEAYVLPVAIPPLAEQHRIVAKVDELMALCDRLEAEQTDATSAHAKLVETLLGTLTQSCDADELAANWQRLSQHFDTLFSTETSLDALKQTILQLAVMGKLVPQDPKVAPIVGKLGDCVDFLNGYAFKSEWFVKAGVRLLRNANVAHGGCNWKDAVYVPTERFEEFKRFELELGDLVLSLDRPIINTGLKIARITEADMPCLLLQRVAKISSQPNAVVPDYLFLWFNSASFTHTIDPGRSNGVPHISTKQVASIPFTRYSIAEQHRIVAKVDELMALCDRLKADLAESRTRQARLSTTLIDAALLAA
jgi:type I restriction enzyme S subunit